MEGRGKIVQKCCFSWESNENNILKSATYVVRNLIVIAQAPILV